MPTPYSFVQDTGNGVTKQFAIPFPYIAREDVHAYLDGVETTAFTWINSSMIEFTVAPGNNVIVERRRRTPIDQLVVNMSNGSTLTEADMDAAHLQTLYAQQELDDVKNYAVILTSDGAMDAQGKRIKNVGTPTQATDAATKGYVDSAYAASPVGHAISAHNDIEVTATPEAGALLVGNDSAVSKWDKQAIGATGQVLEVDLALPKRVKWSQGLRNLLTTAGDLIVATAAGVGARLGVGGKGALLVGTPGVAEKVSWLTAGADGKYLRANSSLSTGLEFANAGTTIDATAYGLVGDNSTDNTAAFNAAITSMIANGDRYLFFPKGNYKFNSKPNDIPSGIILMGAGIVQTTLIRNYNAGSGQEGFLVWTGLNEGGGGAWDMSIQAGQSTSSGAAIKLVATAAKSPDGANFRNLWVTVQGSPAGTWNYTVYVDGSARSSPQGVRDTYWQNCHIFGASTSAIYLNNVVGYTFVGGGVYSAGGATGKVTITGGSTYGTDRSALVHLVTNIQDELNLTACESVHMWGYLGSLNSDATARNCKLEVVCTGTVVNNLTTSSVDTHGAFSLGTNGYHRLPSGLIIQWMTCLGITGTPANFAWPLTFPSGCYAAAVMPTANAVVYTTGLSSANITLAAGANQGAYVVGLGK